MELVVKREHVDMVQNRIQVLGSVQAVPPVGIPPVPVKMLRRNAAAPVRVYVSNTAIEEIWQVVTPPANQKGRWLSLRTRHERGGALIGHYAVDPQQQRFVDITSARGAPDARASRATIDIRAEDWQAIHGFIAKNAGLQLLGWYHSHPGFGVHMSPTDRETQACVFPEDWQVGLVADPGSRKMQFYLGARALPARWLAIY